MDTLSLFVSERRAEIHSIQNFGGHVGRHLEINIFIHFQIPDHIMWYTCKIWLNYSQYRFTVLSYYCHPACPLSSNIYRMAMNRGKRQSLNKPLNIPQVMIKPSLECHQLANSSLHVEAPPYSPPKKVSIFCFSRAANIYIRSICKQTLKK